MISKVLYLNAALLLTNFFACTIIENVREIRTLDENHNEIINEYQQCDNGELSDHKIWSKWKPLNLEYDKDTKISCLDITGNTVTLEGGLLDCKIKIDCMSNKFCEIKVFTQPFKKCTPTNISQEYIWPDKNSIAVNFTEYLIACMDITGSYQILSGGIGFDYVNLKCLSNNCIAILYKSKIEKCKGIKVVVQNFTRNSNFLYKSKNVKITCMQIKGRYETYSDQTHMEIIEIKCLSTYCEVKLFAYSNYESQCIQSNFNIREEWNNSKPFNLTLDKDDINKIVCFIVSGSYELIYGGLHQRSLSLKCLNKRKCVVIVSFVNPYGMSKADMRNIEINEENSTTTEEILFEAIRTVNEDTTTTEQILSEAISTVNEITTTTERIMSEAISTVYEITTTEKGQLRIPETRCTDYNLLTKKVWNNSQPLSFQTKNKIKCLTWEGKYDILSGGVESNSVVAQCTSYNCTLRVYSISNNSFDSAESCDNYTLFLKKEWTSYAPLVFNLKEVIQCFIVEGQYTVISGSKGSKSLVIDCTSDDKCTIEIYTAAAETQSCEGFKLFLKKEWTDFAPLVINLQNKTIIDCFKVEGKYKLVAGGIGTHSVILECSTSNCSIEIYVGNKRPYILISRVDKCGGELLKNNCWDKTKPLITKLEPTSEIFCMNISGGYKIHSGGIGESYIEIECIETTDCCIDLFYVDIFDEGFIGGCSYGKLEMQKRWDSFTIQNIELGKNVQIVCYNTKGKQVLLSGGTGTNFLQMDCQDEKGCLVELFTVRSEAYTILSRYYILLLFIYVLFIICSN